MKQGMSRTKRYVFIALGLVCLCIALAAVVLPHCIKFAARPWQEECVTNLKSLFTQLKIAPQPPPGSELTFSQIGFSPERDNRYSYFMAAGPMEDRSLVEPQGSENARAIGVDTFKFPELRVYTLDDIPRELASQVGVTGTWPNLDFVAVCVGQAGKDPKAAPEVWSVASRDRTLDGELVASGEPYRHAGGPPKH